MSSDALSRPCPVCRSSDFAPSWTKGVLRLVRCLNCGMVCANPVEKQYASGEYYDEEAAIYYLSSAKLQSDYSPVRFAREIKLFRRYCKGGKVFDIGCGSGAFLHQLTKQFPDQYQVLGTDVSGPPLDYAESQGIPVLRGEFLNQQLHHKFQAITCWAVLEHLFEPKAFVAKAASLLEKGGYFFALVPNLTSLAIRMIGSRYRYVYVQHLNYFSARTLARLGEPEFAVERIHYTHFNPMVIWQDWRAAGREVSNAERGELLKKTTAMKQRAALMPVKMAYGLTEKVLAGLGLTDNVAIVFRKK